MQKNVLMTSICFYDFGIFYWITVYLCCKCCNLQHKSTSESFWYVDFSKIICCTIQLLCPEAQSERGLGDIEMRRKKADTGNLRQEWTKGVS